MNLEREIVAAYRGWHELEGGRIIDFDLIPSIQDIEHFETRQDVLGKFKKLVPSLGNPKTEECVFLKEKLQASICYLEVLLGLKIPFRDYVADTLGVWPRFIPGTVIEKQKRRVSELLEHFCVPRKRSVSKFLEDVSLNREQAEEEARRSEELYLSPLLSFLGWTDMEIPYQLEIAEEEAYWQAWSGTDSEGGFILTFNFHPCHLWLRGDLEFIFLHEITHFIQMTRVKNSIEAGIMNPAIGLTVVHDPSSFGLEGTADTISLFLPLQLSPFGELAREQRTLRNFLRQNCLIKANSGENLEKLASYILRNHPLLKKEKVMIDLRNGVENPLMRTYLCSYGMADWLFRSWREDLTEEQSALFIKYALSKMTTLIILQDYLEKIKRRL